MNVKDQMDPVVGERERLGIAAGHVRNFMVETLGLTALEMSSVLVSMLMDCVGQGRKVAHVEPMLTPQIRHVADSLLKIADAPVDQIDQVLDMLTADDAATH